MQKTKFYSCMLTIFFLCFFPYIQVHAKDILLKEGKEVRARYAGEEEDAYHYYKVVPKKSGFMEIQVKTSNKEALSFEICNASKKVVAGKIKVPHKETVLHKVKKGKTYYIKTKGIKGKLFKLSYKINDITTLEYAKEYHYRFTNASLNDPKNCLYFKINARETGNLSFMCYPNKEVKIRYYNGAKKILSSKKTVTRHCLTGLGIRSNRKYYIGVWSTNDSKDGTVSIKDLKYQIRHVYTTGNATKGSAKDITYSKSAENLMVAGEKATQWYRIRLSSKRKLNLTFESRFFENAGKGVKLYICNVDGKALHDEAIRITDEAKASYNKKYKMKYPRKTITTGELPAGTYYIKVVNGNKITSGSYKISWK